MWEAAIQTRMCISQIVNEHLISKLLLPKYCGSIDQAAAFPLSSMKLAAVLISFSVPPPHIFLMQNHSILFGVYPTELQFQPH